jgi:fructose-1,6-bisphosphatase/inositol monophosphatase family enzyme
LGVAYDPFLDRMFVGQKGKGAFLNRKKIFVSSIKDVKKSHIAMPIFKSASYQLQGFVDDLVFKQGAQFFPMGSVVYNSMLLSAGEIDGAVFNLHTAHDIAAVKVIVEEAGGKVTDLWGNEQRYDQSIRGALITNGKIHDELVETIRNYL